MRALFTRNSYISAPVTGTPLYIECDVEWTPDQFYDHWYPQGSSAFVFILATAAYSGIGIYTDIGWVDGLALYNTAPLIPRDGRGKHHVKVSLVGTAYHVDIDGLYTEDYTWPYSFSTYPLTEIRFGLQFNGYQNMTPSGDGETVYLDNLKVGTTDGGTDIMNLNFEGGTPFGSFTPVGTVTVVADSVPDEDVGTLPLKLTPKFTVPVTKRAFCFPDVEGDPACLQYTIATPVDGTTGGKLYGACTVYWLAGQSYLEWRPNYITLLAADGTTIIEQLRVYPDDENWEWQALSDEWTDTTRRMPESGLEYLSFVYDSGNITWKIGEHVIATYAVTDTSPIAKVQFGLTQESEDPGSGAFLDDIKIGLTPAYELKQVNFEDGTSGGLTEIGNIKYLDDAAPPTLFQFTPPSSGDEVFAWIGDLNETDAPVYFEFDVSWTGAQEATWGSYSGSFFLITDRDQYWVEYIYHDPDGWWTNSSSFFLDDPLTGVGGSHHIKVIRNGGTNESTYEIDGITYGPFTDIYHGSGSFKKTDGLFFGWVTGGDDLGGCAINNIQIGWTDGGTEIYDQTTDVRNPYEVFTISPGFLYSDADSVSLTDEGTISLNLRPTTEEHYCPSKVDMRGILEGKWSYGQARGKWAANSSVRWSAEYLGVAEGYTC